jgi:hypothetical protein
VATALRLACAIVLLGLVAPTDGYWIERHRLLADDADGNDAFGFSVAIDGDTAVVGAAFDSTATKTWTGSAYIFTRNSGLWAQQGHVFADDGADHDSFGDAIAISGDTMVVAASYDDLATVTNAGSAYVFVRSSGMWSQQAHLFADSPSENDYFGYDGAVAIEGDTIAVGVKSDDTAAGTDAGSVYIFARSAGVWTKQDQVFADDAAPYDGFGHVVALSGDTLLVGTRVDSTPAGTNAGSAYVFTRSGSTWTQQAHLYADDAGIADWFGTSGDIDGDTIVLGARFDDTPAGSDAGSAYVFTRSGGLWSQTAHIYPDASAADFNFGTSVAISGDIIVVGTPYDDPGAGSEAGTAFVFRRIGGTWVQQAHVYASSYANDERFGERVDVWGKTILIGARRDDTPAGQNAGSAYIFGPPYFGTFVGNPPEVPSEPRK